jgi:hypothetical protein
MAGAVSLQNTTMASNMILDTSYSNEKVKKVGFEWFILKIKAENRHIFAFLDSASEGILVFVKLRENGRSGSLGLL